jgi:phosphatidylethanolamine-binding protein (PEBP) family uncharacterized protein
LHGYNFGYKFVPDSINFNGEVMLKLWEQKSRFWHIFLLLIGIMSLNDYCEKKSQDPENSVFILTSPDISSGGILPVTYTCDGESATLPLEWSGYPEDTKYFALIMHHVASPEEIHWYWVVYNIPLSVNAFSRNVSITGTLGNNSVNGKTQYAPPCSQGPGPKEYIYTIYALSDSVTLSVLPSEVNREVLLDGIKDITLVSATLTVIYSRDI